MLLNCGARGDLRVHWTARSNQSFLKEINPEYPLEGTGAESPIIWPPHQEMTHWKRALTTLMAQATRGLPAMQEICIWFLGWEDPLEKERAIHSSILGWKIPRTEEPGRLQFMGLQRVIWQIGSGQTGDGKSEHWHSRNQQTKMDWNGWI